jgi:hypothetical protein
MALDSRIQEVIDSNPTLKRKLEVVSELTGLTIEEILDQSIREFVKQLEERERNIH